MRTLRLLCVLGCVALPIGSASVGHADSWVAQTRCDTLSVDPLTISVEFDVTPALGQYTSHFQVIPLPQEAPGACVVQQCVAPDGWLGSLHPNYKGADFGYFQNYLPGGSRAGPFRIVIGAVPCSYMIRYFIPGLPEWVFEETVTFTPSVPVPVIARTWGELKAHYR